MIKCKVRVRKSALNYFRSKARDNPKEIQAYLIGKVISPELVVIEEFAYPKTYAAQTTGEVSWYQVEFDEVKRSAEERGFRVVGDLHSHPSWDAVMSASDYKSLIEDGHRVCGLCSINGRRTRVRFWIAESALPLDIVYE